MKKFNKRIIAIAPHRISICGGGTDFPSFYQEYGGEVINFAISRFSTIKIDKLKNTFVLSAKDVNEQYNGTIEELSKIKNPSMSLYSILKKGIPIRLTIRSDVPPGSGLGSSGTLAVNLINSLHHLNNNKKLSAADLANKAYNLEANILKKAVGKQDHMPAAFGGFNHILYRKNKITVTPFKKNISDQLTEFCLLFYLGTTRDADKILRRQEQRVQSRSYEMIDVLKTLNKLTKNMKKDLNSGNFKDVGNTLESAWSLKKEFTKGVTNKFINKVHDVAKDSGAYGAKVTGAGGGGHFLVISEKENHNKIIKNLRKIKCKQIPFKIEHKGARIKYGK